MFIKHTEFPINSEILKSYHTEFPIKHEIFLTKQREFPFKYVIGLQNLQSFLHNMKYLNKTHQVLIKYKYVYITQRVPY